MLLATNMHRVLAKPFVQRNSVNCTIKVTNVPFDQIVRKDLLLSLPWCEDGFMRACDCRHKWLHCM